MNLHIYKTVKDDKTSSLIDIAAANVCTKKKTRGLYHVSERRYFNFSPGRFSEIVAILTAPAVLHHLHRSKLCWKGVCGGAKDGGAVGDGGAFGTHDKGGEDGEGGEGGEGVDVGESNEGGDCYEIGEGGEDGDVDGDRVAGEGFVVYEAAIGSEGCDRSEDVPELWKEMSIWGIALTHFAK